MNFVSDVQLDPPTIKSIGITPQSIQNVDVAESYDVQSEFLDVMRREWQAISMRNNTRTNYCVYGSISNNFSCTIHVEIKIKIKKEQESGMIAELESGPQREPMVSVLCRLSHATSCQHFIHLRRFPTLQTLLLPYHSTLISDKSRKFMIIRVLFLVN